MTKQIEANTIEFGLSTFVDVTKDGTTGELVHPAQAIRDALEQGVRAEELGLDYYEVGEHHRDDLVMSAPDILLAALAARTERIKLGTAVVVLSTDDPVRLHERFNTLDALSNGRATITLGRGSFTESYPLFGYDLRDYEKLFEEKLDLFVQLRDGQPVTWQGTTRAPLTNTTIHPPKEGDPIETWVAVGGSPESVVRAARHGLPLVLAIIGGDPRRFTPYVDLYHQALDKFEKPEQPVAIHLTGHIADDGKQARDDLWENTREMWARIGRERGWAPQSRVSFEAEAGPRGAKIVGDPEEVAQKIAAALTNLGATRFQLQYGAGTMPHEKLMRSIELYATEVVPRVRELVAQ